MEVNLLALSQLCIGVVVLMLIARKPAAPEPEPRIVTIHRLAPGERALVRVNQRLDVEQHKRLTEWLKAQPALAGVEFVLLDEPFEVMLTGATE